MKLVTVMRVKNEQRILPRALESLRPLKCQVILLDDGSTDDTAPIAQSFDFVDYHRQLKDDMDEGRDRTFLLRRALKLEPEWIFTLDGDEELPPRTVALLWEAFEEAPDDINVLRLCIAFMWGEDKYVKMPWEPFMHNRAFRPSHMEDRGFEFKSRRAGNLHCGAVPTMKDACKLRLPCFIKSFGYDCPESYLRHLQFYTEHDETLDTHKQVIERLRHPLGDWHDYEIPREWTIGEKKKYLDGIVKTVMPQRKRNGNGGSGDHISTDSGPAT